MASRPRLSPNGRLGRAEVAAFGVVALWVVWVVVAAAAAGEVLSPTSPYVLATLALVAGVALGSLLVHRVDPSRLAIGLVVVMTLLLVTALLSQGATALPLGYANANAALALQVVALAGLVLVRLPPGRRWSMVLVIAGGVGVVLLNRSTAAAALAVPLVLTLWWSTHRRATQGRVTRRHTAAVLGGLASAGAVAAVVWLARLDQWPDRVEQGLSSTRHTLWRDALSGLGSHPLVGLGPGNFTRVSAVGQDADLGAAHSAVLQVGAETGWPGVVLFALLTGTALWWVSRRSMRAGVIGSAAVAALMVHAQVDHLVEYAPLVLVAGLVIGMAGATPASEQLDVPEGEGPVARRGGSLRQGPRGEDRTLSG